jgi:hypothetical protein
MLAVVIAAPFPGQAKSGDCKLLLGSPGGAKNRACKLGLSLITSMFNAEQNDMT